MVVALAAAALSLWNGAAGAQETPPLDEVNQPLDPSAPMDPLPDLGVEWPNLEEPAETPIADRPDTAIADAETERTYTVRLEGLEAIADEGLLAQFNQLSTLEARRKNPANAAQIDRRAREDAVLLGELLRGYGYYDAQVATRVEAAAAAGAAQVTLEAQPGPQYRFAEVALPGIDAAGADAAALREAFGIDPNDPVNSAAAAMRSPMWGRWTWRSIIRRERHGWCCRSSRTVRGASAGSSWRGGRCSERSISRRSPASTRANRCRRR